MKVVSFVNMKGGVAKTTLAVNVADCLVRRHQCKVLVVDMDPQFNATQCLISGEDYVSGLKDGRHTIVQVFDDTSRPVVSSTGGPVTREPMELKDIMFWPLKENLDLLPGALDLYRLEMGGGQGREARLRRLVDELKKNADYDYIIIDTPPTPSVWMSAALIASDYYVVPVKPEPLSATGIDLLRVVVQRVSQNFDLDIDCLGVILTIAEENTIVFRNAKEFIDGNDFWSTKLFVHHLPKRTEVARMQDNQRMILDSSDSVLLSSISGITSELVQRMGGTNG